MSGGMGILTLNAGSSSLKFSVFDRSCRLWADGAVDSASRPNRYTWRSASGPARSESVSWSGAEPAVRRIVADARSLERSEPAKLALNVVVHRVVHGGARFGEPVLVTADVRDALGELTELAPLHNPPSLEVMDVAREALPGVAHVAVFDTAFHSTLAPEAYTYPLPHEWTERWKLRRFGFHGLSHAYCASRAAEIVGGSVAGLRIVIAHLGNGASVTAVRDGQSVDTSMGFTPLEGLMMGTRSGSVDPGLLMHLQLTRGVSAERLNEALNHESGLLGVSGVSSDMRKVVDASRAGNPRATLAMQMFVHRARQAIGALAVTLGGVDVLVFSGGIGEHSGEVRRAICEGLACVGLELDQQANASARPDATISSHASRGQILVLTAREDLMMAREALRCLNQSRPDGAATES
jgi:acetate kinase